MSSCPRESALTDRVALVTGASSGIGAATARSLHAAGAEVVLAARRLDRLEKIAGELSGASVLELDVRDAGRVEEQLAGRTFDIVVPNAGLARGLESLREGKPEEWGEVIDTNVKGVLHVLRATVPAMLSRASGDVVLIGSVAGRHVYPGGGVYCATKHAVRALYETLRLESGGAGVRFSTVDPGLVETDFSRVRFRGDQARADAVYADTRPLTPEDVADAITWVVTRPPHVNIGELVLWPTDQASPTQVTRR
jgi:3-hydroxy acid dehydrogenase / malonic semialdehyde reductase